MPSIVLADEAEAEAAEAEAMEAEAMEAEAVENGEAEAAAPPALASVSLYGSLRVGVRSGPTTSPAGVVSDIGRTGTVNGSSRWGITGTAEVAEGLTGVFKYETALDAGTATAGAGRLSYVGLSGGFGSINLGRTGGAAGGTFGGIVDNSTLFGASNTNAQVSNSIHYSVTVGNANIQANAVMDRSAKNKKTLDSYEFGASFSGLMETGKVAISHIDRPDAEVTYDPTPADAMTGGAVGDAYDIRDNMTASGMSKSSISSIGAEYGIGGMTMYIGYSRDKSKNTGCDAKTVGRFNDYASAKDITPTEIATMGNHGCVQNGSVKTTYAGIRGGVGDTGVSYLFQLRRVKSSTTSLDTVDGTTVLGESTLAKSVKAYKDEDEDMLPNVKTVSYSPWMLGLYRSLGGGTSVNFEYSDPDGEGDSKKGTSMLWVQVNF